MISDQAIEQLIQERSVERLLDCWAIAMDRNDWKGVEACLASEFTLLAPPIVTYADPKPRAQAISEIASRNGKVGGFHCLPGKVVTIEGSKAHVISRMIGGHWALDDKAAWEMAYGFYHIDLVQEEGSWRISSLTIEMLFNDGPGLFDRMASN